MFSVVILPLAKRDINDAAYWYNSRQKGLGKRFTTEVRRAVNFIKQNPYGYAVRYDEVRTSVLDIFPFMAHYTVDEAKRIIVIIAVLHTSRNPDFWKIESEDIDDV